MIMTRLPRTALVAEEFGDAIWGNHAGRQIACSDTASWWPPWSWWWWSCWWPWWWWWWVRWRHFLGANKGESVVLRQIQCGTYCLAALNCPLSRDPTFIASELRSPIPPFCHQSTSSSSLNLCQCLLVGWGAHHEEGSKWGEFEERDPESVCKLVPLFNSGTSVQPLIYWTLGLQCVQRLIQSLATLR